METTCTGWIAAAPGTELAVLQLDACSHAADELNGLLSAAERARAARLRGARHRARWTVARACLRTLLAERLDTDPHAIEFSFGAHGKPAVDGSEWHFNVSHSGGIAVFAFSKHFELGVDVERVRQVAESEAIVERFFSARERDAYASLAPGQQALGFANAWTRKEAVCKAAGEALHARIAHIEVTLAPGEPARVRAGAPGVRLHASFEPVPG
jgi:4'-phosphopantetheinyl transferase